ncbi:4-(cytidine 5'-diphospho)-2-C-methyl-D-erythritol kinase [Alkalibacter rhizosphaerae]|uniref:4-(cytidine 5'-diphospho)-2-C-methyl-D-erythritol kinase n=1 Tax=Alkalibacter rhizosphaerae TaxID=2815577 RepID=A0A974XCX7_9FIRM|nr:4-(cytidine 5'-diphospho)-2-C-methyl-D-erythritol kinase [Alkalibacter rhizosphaerae]QSX07514.1 4-(cytidine 5'-diphospho)-2-C-methyl-D-erythritol kinase [Alkalibacter rhizosphaerae]
MKTTIRTPAKINLTLDILGKREDGYHDLSMIMQTVDLCDVLTLEEGEGGIQVGCTDPRIPCDPSNLVYKAARVIMEKAGIRKGIRIHIEKNIPLEAGLAGGSANAAGVLKALNAMWELGMSRETLMDLGNTIGADVPFCLLGGRPLQKGRGIF